MPDPETPSDAPGELAGPRYCLDARFAQGGMGALWRARESGTDRSVALKRILRDANPESLRRFLTEARITAQLEHPNIVPIHGLGTDPDGKPFYTMKLVRGIDLDVVLKKLAAGDAGILPIYPLAELLIVFQKVCDAVAFAHSRGIIHRDLKPANIMLGPFGEVLVMDWGLAKVLGHSTASTTREDTAVAQPFAATGHEDANIRDLQAGQSEQTIPGSALGSPHFMAPEQARGEVHRHDPRTDAYALGAILYQILSLRRCVSGSSVHAVLQRVRTGDLDPLVLSHEEVDDGIPLELRPAKIARPALHHLPERTIPESLAAVVRHAMAFKPEDRYQSVIDLQREITAFQNGFATGAEQASFGKQIFLALRRHRREATIAAGALISVLALATGAFVRIRAERDRAERLAIAEAKERDRAEHLVIAEAKERRNADEERGNAETQRHVAEAKREEAELATHEAKTQKKVAEQESKRAEGLLKEASLSSLTTAQDRFAEDDWRGGVAYLGRALTYDPQNEFAASLLAFQLIYGNATCNGIPLHVLHHEDSLGAAFSPDGKQLVTSSTGFVRLWNVNTGRVIGEPIADENDDMRQAYFVPDGSRLLITRISGGAHLIDLRTRKRIELEVEHENYVLDTAFSPGGALLVTASRDGTAGVWDLTKDGRPVCPLLQHEGQGKVVAAAFSSDGSRFATYCSTGYARLWNAQTRRSIGPALWHGKVHADGTICFSPDSRFLLSTGGDGTARLWDSVTGKPFGTPMRHAKSVNCAAFSPDGRLIATASDDGTARLWETLTGRIVGQPLQHRAEVHSVAFSPDGFRVVTACEDGTARLWDALTGEPLGQPLAQSGAVYTAKFSPDGNYVVTEGDQCVIWDTLSGCDLAQSLVGNERVTEVRRANGVTTLRIEEASGSRTCEIPQADVPDRTWIGDVVAAVTGLEFSGNGGLEEMPFDKGQQLRAGLLARIPAGDGWASLYRWWMTRGPERGTVPGGKISFRQQATQRLPGQLKDSFTFNSDERSRGHIEEDIRQLFHGAVSFDPTHPLLPLIRAFLEKDQKQAATLRHFAIKRLPADVNIRKAAAEILRLQKQPELAMQVYREQQSSIEPVQPSGSVDNFAVLEKKADIHLNEVYSVFKKSLDDAGRQALKQEQIDWLTVRDSIFDSKERIEFIESRIEELKQRTAEHPR